MTNNIYLLAFGTFGNPYGFRQSFFKIDNESVAKSIKTFDLNTNAIQLFPKSEVYAIRKEVANGLNSVSYSKYTFAKEQHSDRGGTFIGSSIFFTNEIADENITVSKLNEFHGSLVEKNVQNDILLINHSDNFSVDLPKDFDKLDYNHKQFDELINFNTSNRNLVVYCDTKPENLQKQFYKSIDLLNIYDCIYFTSNQEVATFVHQKGIFELAKNSDEFELKIQNLKDERTMKINSSIQLFEKEKEKLEIDRKKQLNNYKAQVEHNKKLHQLNHQKIEDSKNQITQLEQEYARYLKKINEAIDFLKNGKKLNDIEQFHNNNKIEFINYLNENIKPTYLSTISPPKTKTDLNIDNKKKTDLESQNDKQPRKRKFKGFKFLSFLFFTLWILTLVYFSIPDEKTQPEILAPHKPALSPTPNNQLNQNDYKIVANHIDTGLTINQVIKVIFDENPTDIKKHYENQKDLYSKQIIEKNKSCFTVRKGETYFIKDTIKIIPSYKTDK